MTHPEEAHAQARAEMALVGLDLDDIEARAKAAEDALVAGDGLTPERMCMMAVSLIDDTNWLVKQLRGAMRGIDSLIGDTITLAQQVTQQAGNLSELRARIELLEAGQERPPRTLQ